MRELWLSDAARANRLRYPAEARLQARPASMPVIEQVKAVIMAQSGWLEAEAFDALRRASQRSNVPVRELAAAIVARTVAAGWTQRERTTRHQRRSPALAKLPEDTPAGAMPS